MPRIQILCQMLCYYDIECAVVAQDIHSWAWYRGSCPKEDSPRLNEMMPGDVYLCQRNRYFFIDLIAYSQPVLSHYLFIFKLLPYPLLTHGQLNSINKTDNGTGVKSVIVYDIVSFRYIINHYLANSYGIFTHILENYLTHPPVHNGRHFADDIFICILVNEKKCALIEISLKFVPRDPIDNNPALV